MQNEEVSGGIDDELRAEIENLCGSITSPDERFVIFDLWSFFVDESSARGQLLIFDLCSVMESDFLVATALNPERILLLNEEQITYARRELERRVRIAIITASKGRSMAQFRDQKCVLLNSEFCENFTLRGRSSRFYLSH